MSNFQNRHFAFEQIVLSSNVPKRGNVVLNFQLPNNLPFSIAKVDLNIWFETNDANKYIAFLKDWYFEIQPGGSKAFSDVSDRPIVTSTPPGLQIADNLFIGNKANQGVNELWDKPQFFNRSQLFNLYYDRLPIYDNPAYTGISIAEIVALDITYILKRDL